MLRCPTIALTATATPEVRRDICRQLRLDRPVVVARGFDRTNLSWHVLAAKNDAIKDHMLRALLRSEKDGAAVVYAPTRKAVDSLTDLFHRTGVRAVGYHAGIPGPERERLQNAFMQERVRVVVATNAFGMGIDKANVRLVAHYAMPGTLEAYYQEAGRAGRDRADARCVLLYTHGDHRTHEFLIDQGHPGRAIIESVYAALRSVAAGGRLAPATREDVARLAPRAAGVAQVDAALRSLAEFNVIRNAGHGGGAPTVRMIATRASLADRLAADPTGLAVAGALFRLLGNAAHRGRGLTSREVIELERAADRAQGLAATLDRLHAAFVLDWAARPEGERVELLGDWAPDRLPIDWDALAMRTARERRRLRAMEGYAITRRCRRAYVLRYFGDDYPMRRCTGCDICLGATASLLPGASPPRALRRRLRIWTA